MFLIRSNKLKCSYLYILLIVFCVILSDCFAADDIKLVQGSDMDMDGFSAAQGDCDDANPLVFPAAREVCDGIDNNCNGEVDLDGPCETCLADTGTETRILSVQGGVGSREVPVGTWVYVNALEQSGVTFSLPWLGLPDQVNSREWEQSFIMPDIDVSLLSTQQAVDLNIEASTFTGSTLLSKTVYAIFPDNPVGIIFTSHGTGGSADFILKAEASIWASRAVHRGFAVVSTEAEERVAGDLDGNGKIRWDSKLDVNNIDFANINFLIEGYISSGQISADLPRFAIGMSNGGSFSISLGAVSAAQELKTEFPLLDFVSIASYCASGRLDATSLTQTPTAWYMCGYDLNDSVGEQGNIKALQYSQGIEERGIDTQYAIHSPSPLFDERLTRFSGINVSESSAIIANIRKQGFVSECGYLSERVEVIKAMMDDNPALFPVYSGFNSVGQREVKKQLKAAYADHEFYSAYAERNLDYFVQHLPTDSIFSSSFEQNPG